MYYSVVVLLVVILVYFRCNFLFTLRKVFFQKANYVLIKLLILTIFPKFVNSVVSAAKA